MQEPPTPSDTQRLLSHLPAIYQDQPAVAAFLGALERILFEGTADQPGVAAIIDGLPTLMHPDATPTSFLPWLATWVGLRLSPDLPEETRRLLLRQAIPLYQRRGTKGGLQDLLDIVTGGAAVVVEPETAGFRLGGAIVGQTTRIGRDRPHLFEVLIEKRGSDPSELARLERLIRTFTDQAKPAHTQYSVRVVANPVPRTPPRRQGAR